jgi:hypothetical protein
MLDSPRWQASALLPKAYRVAAENEDAARKQIAQAAMRAVKTGPLGTKIVNPPWEDPTMVSCKIDNSKNVPAGAIVGEDGKPIRTD